MANARLTVQNDVDVLQLLSEAKHAATQAMTACDALHDVLESGAARSEFSHRARFEALDIAEKLRDLREQIQAQRTEQAGRVRRRISEGIFPVPPPVRKSHTASPRDAAAGQTQSQEGSCVDPAHAREC